MWNETEFQNDLLEFNQKHCDNLQKLELSFSLNQNPRKRYDPQKRYDQPIQPFLLRSDFKLKNFTFHSTNFVTWPNSFYSFPLFNKNIKSKQAKI